MRALALMVVVAAGCGYTSEYVAPRDGRVRAVWRDNRVVVDAGGEALPGLCLAHAAWLSGSEKLRLADGDLAAAPLQPPDGRVPVGLIIFVPPLRPPWIPLVPRPGLPFAHAAVPLPRLAPHGPAPVLARAPSTGGVRLAGGGGGGGGDLGKAAVVLAVIALVVLPIVDVLLATLPAEAMQPSQEAIDQVNALNDLLRLPGSACAP